MELKLSIIVPIYNVQAYLPICIESIINQTYKNLEIILVNDGSTDSSLSICKYYSKRDSRIKIIDKANGGLSSARNAGLNVATGHYIAFVDSDDYLDLDMYSLMITFAKEKELNVVSCGINYIYPNCEYTYSSSGKRLIYNLKDAILSVFSKRSSIRFEVWNKIYKFDLIKEVRFKEKQVYEDIYFDRLVLLKEKFIGYIDLPLYNYLCLREGNTNSWFNKNRLCFFTEVNDFISDLESLELYDCSNVFKLFYLDTATSLYCDSKRLKAGGVTNSYILLTFKRYFFAYASFFNYKIIKFIIFYFNPNIIYFLHIIKTKLLRKFSFRK